MIPTNPLVNNFHSVLVERYLVVDLLESEIEFDRIMVIPN